MGLHGEDESPAQGDERTVKQTRARRLVPAEYQALAAFRHEMRRFAAFSETAARGAGLTPQHHQALLAIKGAPGPGAVTVGELSERLLIRHHSAVELVDRLARAGLVQRDSDPQDRRRVLLSLTEDAERLMRELSAAHLEELRRVGPSLRSLLAALDNA